MRILFVYAHPEKKSFTGALKEMAISALTQDGHELIFTTFKWIQPFYIEEEAQEGT